MARKLIDYFRKEDLERDYPLEKFMIRTIKAVDSTNPSDGSTPQNFITVELERASDNANDLSSSVVIIRKPVFQQTHPLVYAKLEEMLESKVDYTNKFFMLRHFTLRSKVGFKFNIMNETTGKMEPATYRIDTGDHKKGDRIVSNKHTFTLFKDVDTLESQATRLMNRLEWAENPTPSAEDSHDSSAVA